MKTSHGSHLMVPGKVPGFVYQKMTYLVPIRRSGPQGVGLVTLSASTMTEVNGERSAETIPCK